MKEHGRTRKRKGTVDEVVLRRWRKDGEVIALFPEEPATPDGLITSYQHTGQHGAASYDHVLGRTAPVPLYGPDRERDELLDELRDVGYKPVVRQRKRRRAKVKPKRKP